MSSQWVKFKDKLAEFAEEPSYQAKIDDAKQFLLGTLSGEDANKERLAKLYQDRRAEKAKYEEALYGVNVELAALSQLLIENYEADGIEKSTLASGATGYIGYFVSVSIEDSHKFYSWLREQKMDDLRTVHPSKLKGMTSEMLQAGQAAPPGVKVYLGQQFRILNGGKGE